MNKKPAPSPAERCAACGHGAHGNHVCPGCLMGCGSSLPPPVPSPATPCQVYPCPCACHRQGPHVPTDECAEAVGDVRRPLSDYTREELDMLYAETAEEDLQLANDPFGEIAALRAALTKTEEENERLLKRFREECDCVRLEQQRDTAEARVAELEKALRELHGRTGLCHGAIMGFGCSGNYDGTVVHSPKCATVAALNAKP